MLRSYTSLFQDGVRFGQGTLPLTRRVGDRFRKRGCDRVSGETNSSWSAKSEKNRNSASRVVQIFRPTRTYSRNMPRRHTRHLRHSVQMDTFLPSTFGRCLAALVSVISSSFGPIRLSCRVVCFAASHKSFAMNRLRAFCALFEPLFLGNPSCRMTDREVSVHTTCHPAGSTGCMAPGRERERMISCGLLRRITYAVLEPVDAVLVPVARSSGGILPNYPSFQP